MGLTDPGFSHPDKKPSKYFLEVETPFDNDNRSFVFNAYSETRALY